MESTFYQLSLITTGVSIALGLCFFIFGLKQKGENEYLIFGIIGLLLSVFFLLPPTGFILHDAAPYTLQIEIKRIFIFGYYALIPLFIVYYTGYRKLWFVYFILLLTSVCYLFMALTQVDSRTPFWFVTALVIFFSILAFGIRAGIWQWKHDNKKDAIYLLSALSVYGIGLIFTCIHQFFGSFLSSSGEPKFFYPLHLNSIFFMAIMSLRLVTKTYEKFKLESFLSRETARWNEFMQNVPVIVLELDSNGNVVFINEYGLQLLGYGSEEDLKGKNWSEHFIPEHEWKTFRRIFSDAMAGTWNQENQFLKNNTLRADGKRLKIQWVNYLPETGQTQSKSLICLGRDVTQEEAKNEQIKKLQLEIEKENLTVLDTDNLNREEFVGKSNETQYLLGKISLVAGTLVPVLIQGETGVGKELVADMIHMNSLRSDKPFVKVNCGALPGELIEDELFGHEKGAFTSAIQARKGRFELADGGTIFLDEIGELPLELQPKLLRILQDGKFERVGGQKTIKVDVRVVAASNRNLEAEIANRRFRADLFYRLNVFPITVPALRNRKDDLDDLISNFVSRMSTKYGRNVLQISKANMQRLKDYTWPGNVRELKNVLERSILASDGETLKLDWFVDNKPATPEFRNSKSLKIFEKEYIQQSLEDCDWKINGIQGAAEKLEMHPNTLRSRMKKLGISRP